jgi:hypothetical protein
VERIVVESSSGCLDIEIKFAPSYSSRLALYYKDQTTHQDISAHAYSTSD